MFEDEDAYVSHIAVRLYGTADRESVATLATRLRQVRNPTLLGDVSPQAAADALRESLPGVAEDVISATADALAESDATREAFERDREAARLLAEFSVAWSGHATDVVASAHRAASDAATSLRQQHAKVRGLVASLTEAERGARDAAENSERVELATAEATTEVRALEDHESYRAAGRLSDLKTSAGAKGDAAKTQIKLLQTTAQSVAAESESVRRQLEEILEDLNDCRERARRADPQARVGAPTFDWKLRPRAPRRAGGVVVEAGAELTINGTGAKLRDAASSWLALGQTHVVRSDAAALAISDHKEVAVIKDALDRALKDAAAQSALAETEWSRLRKAGTAAQEAALGLLLAVRLWMREHPELTGGAPGLCGAVEAEPEPWDLEAIDALQSNEPSAALATCDGWGAYAVARAERAAGDLRARSKRSIEAAKALQATARELREQAAELRSGRLLPFPRPDWAGPDDDRVALGAMLDWNPEFGDHEARARVEAAMAAAGLLGASIDADGAFTRLWRVVATGPTVSTNIAGLLLVDPASPNASAALAVLSRIELAPSASPPPGDAPSALCIGRDGTFAAGSLRGRVPGADDPSRLPPASHVGGHQRRVAALARAEVLEVEAASLEVAASKEERLAEALALEATTLSAAGQSFPARDELRRRETHRSEVALRAQEAQRSADSCRDEAERMGRQHAEANSAWSERTRSRGLPADLITLAGLRDRGREVAAELSGAASPLSGKLAERLDGVLARHASSDSARALGMAERDAQSAVLAAEEAATTLRVLEETVGEAIAEILERHAKASERLAKCNGEREPARKRQSDAVVAHERAQVTLEKEQEDIKRLERDAQTRLTDLRALLTVPGVASAVLDGPPIPADEHLVAQLELSLRDRKTVAKKTVRERADNARAQLAGLWSFDPGEDHGELLTWIVTQGDATYTPVEGAQRAEALRQRAEAALAVAEERSLRDFVIGRLPAAIGTAWVLLQDWVNEVNRKMRSAAASSGVGVQVRAPLRGDLPPASQTVYELCCKTSGAERSAEQQLRLEAALKSLLAAAPGETTEEKVAAAVDIRDWVEVHYEVTRPEGRSQRWNSKTGLSGGERRLVVLAPMLAALAASYDRFGDRVFRLAVLDEVPAEVDERGREGLARYLAELDLDSDLHELPVGRMPRGLGWRRRLRSRGRSGWNRGRIPDARARPRVASRSDPL